METVGIKKRKVKKSEVIQTKAFQEILTNVFMNNSAFSYSLQIKNNSYAIQSTLQGIWNFIYKKNYSKAKILIGEAFHYFPHCSALYFAKFVVTLFLGEDAYPYLKQCIESKNNEKYDEEYSVYLYLYAKINPNCDAEVFIKKISLDKQKDSNSKTTYREKYLEFYHAVKEKNLKLAKEKLDICHKMKPKYLHLEIASELLSIAFQEHRKVENRIQRDDEKSKKNHEQSTDSIYHLIQGSIQKGHYKNAFEIYQKNQFSLKKYQTKLIMDLFTMGISLENKVFMPQATFEDTNKEELEEIPIEVQNQDSLEEEEVLSKLEAIPKMNVSSKNEMCIRNTEDDFVMERLEEGKEEVFYPIEPLLKHLEPTHEYFLYFSKCMDYGQYEEAKSWLNQYVWLLRSNHLNRRLDHHYYRAEVAYMESMENRSTLQRKDELYQYAYSAMRNNEYERALTYLDYYEKIDTCRNNKAYILKGFIYSKMGKYEKAIQNLIHANAISPHPDAYYFLGEIYYKTHSWNDAIFCYITYNEFYTKENVFIYLNLAECYRRLNRIDKTVKYLKIAEEINEEQKLGLFLQNRIWKAQVLYHRTMDKKNLEKEE